MRSTARGARGLAAALVARVWVPLPYSLPVLRRLAAALAVRCRRVCTRVVADSARRLSWWLAAASSCVGR